LAPRPERALTEAAAETFDAGDPDTLQLAAVAIEDGQTGVGENRTDLVRLARLDVVIAEYSRGRHTQRRQFTGKHPRLVAQAVVGEVACKDEDVRGVADAREYRLKGAL